MNRETAPLNLLCGCTRILYKGLMEKLDKIAEIMYLYSMTESQNENQGVEKQDVENLDAEQQAKKARAERIRKMRGWLSPRDSIADDFTAEDEALYYGSGHSGWNR